MSNQSIEEKMKVCKENYKEVTMSNQDFEKYKAKIEQAKLDKRRAKRNATIGRWGAVAAVLALFVVMPNVSATVAYAMGNIPVLGNLVRIVTFRDYTYNDDKNYADVKVPEVVVDTDDISNLLVKENIIKSSSQINEQINELTDRKIEEFEQSKLKEGYHDLKITSEIVRTTRDYFTLKLICYEAGASGYEEYHYYTIDLNTGKELKLVDLFWDNTEYESLISDMIKNQMREQMAADVNIKYFIDSDLPSEDFTQITDETEFYIDENGKIVISFGEAQVAPAYMGCVEFIVDSPDLDDMKKPSTGVVMEEETFDNYDDVIASLKPGMWYATVSLDTAKKPLLLVTEMTYDDGMGHRAAIDADLYAYNENGKIVKYGTVVSCGTAYPLSVSKNYLYTAGNHHVTKRFVAEEYSALITEVDATETFDTNANATYYYYSLEEGFAGKVDDDSKLVELFEEFLNLKVIGFQQK